MSTLFVTYSTNYNGCYIYDETNEDLTDQADQERADKATNCINEIVNKLVDECDKYGRFGGDEDEASDLIIEVVHSYFGDVDVKVEFDNIST